MVPKEGLARLRHAKRDSAETALMLELSRRSYNNV